jgi:hypothetical protein
MLQPPGVAFVGTEPIEYTNADRGLSPTLPIVSDAFDDTFEIDAAWISGTTSQTIAVDQVAPGASPIKVFNEKDDKMRAGSVARASLSQVSRERN